MTEQAPPPQAVLLQMLMGSWVAQALGAVARLGVADHMANGPKTPDELAKSVGADAENLGRTLRALATVGVFTAEADGRYGLSPVGETLQTTVPGSMRYMAIAETDDAHWMTWQRFTEAVRTGTPQAQQALGCMPWDYYAQHPEDGAAFSRAMANISFMSIEPVLQTYEFPAQGTVVDVGGAYGALLAAVLRKQPGLKGVLFDLPHIVAGASEVLGDVGGRVERVGGDFLKDTLPAGDVYLLKHILHDWDDPSSVTILKAVRNAMSPGAKVLVVELVVPDRIEPGPAVWMDLNMMVILGGKERTREQYAALYAQAGLELTRVVATPSPFAVVEGVAV